MLEFEHEWDKIRVLEGRPWVFEGNLFSVEEFDGLTPPTQIVFEKTTFWVRMLNLPLACMRKDVGTLIGSTMGLVEEVDTDIDGVGWGEFLRVRIQLDLTKPLSRGRFLNLQGKSVCVDFQYERLPRYCFNCGIINHRKAGCLKRSTTRSQGGELQYGPWLRVPSPTRRFNVDRYRDGAKQKYGSRSRDGAFGGEGFRAASADLHLELTTPMG